MSRLELSLLIAAVLNVVLVLEFVRRRKLHEGFALLWVGVGIVGVVAALARSLIDRAAKLVGVAYGANLILSAGIAFLFFVCMALSLYVSRLELRVEVLAEEVAFLRGVQEPPREEAATTATQ